MRKYLTILLATISFQTFSQNPFIEEIDSIIDYQLDSDLEPGLTTGVVKDGKLIYHGSKGLMNLEYNVPYNDSTIFGIASITKQFTSACIAILEYQGKLSVDDDVRKHIPELAFSADTIRIKHLLNHTSGIRNHNVLLDLSGFDYEHRGYTNEMIQELMFRQKGMNNRPGAKMLYSNTNYVLLALIVKRVSGMELYQFAEKEIFGPLGMTNTLYRNDIRQIVKNSAYPYYLDNGEYKQPRSLTLCVGAGGVESTISDLAIWSQVFLDPTHRFSYISDFVIKLIPLDNGEQMQHARGIFVTPYKGYETLNHSGRGLGMRSQFICVPDLNLGVIVFTNSEDINAVNVSYKILDLWIKEPAQKSIENKNYIHPNKYYADYADHYQELNSDLKMHIFENNDTLYAKSSFGSKAVKLAAISDSSFSRFDNVSVKYTFLSPNTSESDLLVDFGGALFYFERIELVENPNQKIAEYAGTYFSEELNVTYELTVSDEKLILNYPNNEGLELSEGEKDVFGANRRTKYTFVRDDDNQVNSFYVAAEGTVKDILFEKME